MPIPPSDFFTCDTCLEPATHYTAGEECDDMHCPAHAPVGALPIAALDQLAALACAQALGGEVRIDN